ncbi:MAG: GNAT family protein [Gemmatimonadaceae bacterium]
MDLTPITLEGRHVRLEPLGPEHIDGLTAVGLDPELWRLIPTQITSRAEMAQYVDIALQWRAANSALPFATIARATNTVVGCTRFANVDHANRRVEIGWTWIAPAWQRTAINTEAKYLMFRHAFETLGCIRVELKTDVLNARSRAAMLRIGAKFEGVFRNHMILADRIRDSAYFSVINSEFPEVRAHLEELIQRGSTSEGSKI